MEMVETGHDSAHASTEEASDDEHGGNNSRGSGGLSLEVLAGITIDF
jgi:hypothetical protein